MSMRDYAVNDYGLVLDYNALNLLAARVCEDYTDDGWDKDMSGYIGGVEDYFDLTGIYGFTGDTYKINKEGYAEGNADIYSYDDIHYYALSRYPSLFKAAYKNMTEIVNECKEKFGQYLPDNFDYAGNIKVIVGTVYE